VGGPAPKPKEHPFKQLMREAAEKRKAAAAAAAAPAPAPEREVVEAELVEDDAPSSSVA
jgi:hypothetical protein